jgi:hypothetical protein
MCAGPRDRQRPLEVAGKSVSNSLPWRNDRAIFEEAISDRFRKQVTFSGEVIADGMPHHGRLGSMAG